MTFHEHYLRTIEEGFETDPAHLKVVTQVEELAERLIHLESRSQWRRLIDRVTLSDPRNAIKGIYLWGGVGRGKTFLMDMFYEWLPIKRKRRLHFHHFMQLVHEQLRSQEGNANPLTEIAHSFSDETRLLCFDEFFVSDIADAMILAELLDAMFDRGLVLFATSNTPPAKLYENGLQRSRFLPAIALIQEFTHIIEIGGEHDYRLDALHKSEIYRICYPTTDENISKDQLTLLHRVVDSTSRLVINGRELHPVYQLEGTAAFTFHELCETPRSAPDYIELARLFHTVVLYDVPTLGPNAESAARRFVALIDEFYDRNVNVIFNAEAPIQDLYQGQHLQQVFERTISRVVEMQSDSYLHAAHKT